MLDIWNEISKVGMGTLTYTAQLAAVVAAFWLLEAVWGEGPTGGLVNRGYNLLVMLIQSLGMYLAGMALRPVESWLGHHGLIPWLLPDWKAQGWIGIVLATLVFALVYDFFHYWAHRAQHAVPLFWIFHRVHHNDATMDSSTSVRHSLGAGIIGSVLASFPTTLICGETLLPNIGAYVLFWGWFMFSHANIKLSLGKLGWVFVGPQNHRIHHGRSETYYNRNYAQFFPVYDWLFGTLRHPEKDEWPATGVEGDDGPHNAFSQVFTPWRTAKKSVPSGSSVEAETPAAS
ncbi:MAG TPA: sterol desaturase family protein [Paucimonas sp.]|nr:sterol desaturase family protein [Paucimonas sp.]